MTTVYLSIGLPKTGTTALQTFLRENENVLAQQGYIFPRLKVGIGSRYRNRNGHFLVYISENPDINEKKREEDSVQKKAFDKLGQLAKKYPNIILSDEAIWKIAAKEKNFWSDAVDNFRKIDCQLRVIVYLRRQDLFVQSLWNQHVKSPYERWTKSFDEMMEQNGFSYFPLDYHKPLDKIRKYLGQDNVLVRPYEHGQFEGEDHSIYSDFLHCIGLSKTDQYTTENVVNNLGLRGNFIEIKRILNGIPEYREMDDFMGRSIKFANNYIAQGVLHADTSMFSYEDQKKFLEQYEESNRKIAEQFLNRPDGKLFYEPTKASEKWALNPETMYRDIILVIAEIACEQQKELLNLKKRLDRIDIGGKIFRKAKIVYWKIRNSLRYIFKGKK